jgi:F-type H+-transporting ATPase subunit a
MVTAIMMLEIFVAFLQAYIFAMLTAVFIGLIRHAH